MRLVAPNLAIRRRPLRILAVTSNFPRWEGDSTTPFVLHLAQDLRSLGCDIEVLAPHAPGAAPRETLGGIAVQRFRYLWPARWQTLCYRGGALINLRRQPVNYLQLPPLLATQWLALTRRLRAGRFDLLHSHWILPQGLIGRLARAAVPGAHVITAHGGDVFGLQGGPWRGFKRAALAGADAVTVNSSATEAAVRDLAPSGTRIARIPMGVALDTPDPACRAQAAALRQRYAAPDTPLLLFVGRLVEEKGVADALAALAISRGAGARLLIVGEGQDRAALEARARALGVAERASFVGWVETARLPAYYQAADLLLAPSRRAANGWVEAQGLSLLEAMAAGTPVIATHLGGVVDAVRHGATGWLVPERDAPALAAAIERLLGAPALRQRLAAAAQALVRERFSRQASARAFADLFARCIAARRGAPR